MSSILDGRIIKLLGFSKSSEGAIAPNGFPPCGELGPEKSSSKSANFTNLPTKRNGTIPVSPFLCFAIITSPIPTVERPSSSSVKP